MDSNAYMAGHPKEKASQMQSPRPATVHVGGNGPLCSGEGEGNAKSTGIHLEWENGKGAEVCLEVEWPAGSGAKKKAVVSQK